jgi:hypothetical protein
MAVGDLFHDGEAEPRAGHRTGGGAVEAVKQVRLVI